MLKFSISFSDRVTVFLILSAAGPITLTTWTIQTVNFQMKLWWFHFIRFDFITVLICRSCRLSFYPIWSPHYGLVPFPPSPKILYDENPRVRTTSRPHLSCPMQPVIGPQRKWQWSDSDDSVHANWSPCIHREPEKMADTTLMWVYVPLVIYLALPDLRTSQY